MGVRIGRILKEFVFNNLLDEKIPIRFCAHRKELTCSIVDITPQHLTLEAILGDPESFREDEKLQAYFFFQNNYHLFEAVVQEVGRGWLRVNHPEGVYKNPQRQYSRVQMDEDVEVFFTLKGGQTVELNFPHSPRLVPPAGGGPEQRGFDSAGIRDLYRSFKAKIASRVSAGKIVMLRDKIPDSYEEKLLAATGKALWIPSTEEDFPAADPFSEERVITRRELVKYEESFDRAAHVIAGKLSNILYEKQKKRIHAELYFPVIYEAYLIGYVYLCNRGDKKERIDAELVDHVHDFARVLSYSLYRSGYFSDASADERRYEAPVIDISASGLLFAHPREELAQQLLIHTDLDLTLGFADRRLVIGARVRRKLQDAQRYYYGVQFLKIDEADLAFLFSRLYGRPPTAEDGQKWEGGTPPPALKLFEE